MARKMQLKCSPSACSKSEQHKAQAGISHSSSYSWVAASTDVLGSHILLCGETRVGFEVVENQPYHSPTYLKNQSNSPALHKNNTGCLLLTCSPHVLLSLTVLAKQHHCCVRTGSPKPSLETWRNFSRQYLARCDQLQLPQ